MKPKTKQQILIEDQILRTEGQAGLDLYHRKNEITALHNRIGNIICHLRSEHTEIVMKELEELFSILKTDYCDEGNN